VGYSFIAGKLDTVDGFGPTCVRRFVQETDVLGHRSPEQWQQGAFGQVDAWLRTLGLGSWVLYPSRRLLSTPVSTFLDFLKEALPAGSPNELASFID
jgi:hypothetical protein